MRAVIEHEPSFSWLKIQLDRGETVRAEAGSLVARSTWISMKTRLNARGAGFGGWLVTLFSALVRRILGRESVFVNDYTAGQNGELVLAPVMPGSIFRRQLDGKNRLLVRAGSFLASHGDVHVRVRWGGLRNLFTGNGLFLLECSGRGEIFLNAYGGVMYVDVKTSYVVNSNHVVGYDSTLAMKIRPIQGGARAILFSGEGLVCEFAGEGRLYIQSRNEAGLARWIQPLLKP